MPDPPMSDSAMSRVAAVIGKPPQVHSEDDAPVVRMPTAAVDEAARAIRGAGAAGSRVAVLGIGSGTDTCGTAVRLARALGDEARVVLVGLDPADDEIKAASNDPGAKGLAELAAQTASFRDVITKDKSSHLHLISAGRVPEELESILSWSGIATGFDPLARSYQHVVINAGTFGEAPLEAISEIAPHAVLVAGTLSDAATASARERLLAAGFRDVTVLGGGRAGSPADAATAAAA